MKIHVIASGKLKDGGLRGLADDYVARIGRYTKIVETEVPNGAGLARAVPPVDTLVALEVWGASLSSEAFSSKLGAWSQKGKGEIAFLIGAADGIPKELSARAHFHLSLSQMTLPHRLARVVLFEQLYRAWTILRGEPYAREG